MSNSISPQAAVTAILESGRNANGKAILCPVVAPVIARAALGHFASQSEVAEPSDQSAQETARTHQSTHRG
ncbi:hypothetical protein L1285_20925 [Pseudoalteromonas sp. DL2-H2.2]|uniref:hypothetical protein n=1 Tax=Pseudoalteromonas sp. DL2-H2.2 TaxID=2908889 RepID=UPI001F248992|nr:hypothetical protein [Pseudoalteromonas sp. DL2-H2.2]MCF2910775.1 hypothetical protein [Pseudoalteromonas sp. DL2-H2.2]